MEFDRDKLEAVAEAAFDVSPDNPLTETHALVVSHRGEIVYERYAYGADESTTFLSWSMAKSVASMLCGVLVGQGDIELDQPCGLRFWDGDDPRSAITMRQLLQMRSGLEWNEDYVDDKVSDVIEMLFGSGQDDVAAHAAAKPLGHDPGEHWYYSSGTTNLITRVLGDVIGGGEADFTTALVDNLLTPAGMTTPTIKFDAAATWIGSSFLYATARDYIALGELARNDGIATAGNGERLLPEGWIAQSIEDQATCPDTGQGYGLQWWLPRDGHGSFAASGYEGQRLQMSQKLETTLVRLGKTNADFSDQLHAFYRDITDCFV